MGFMASGGQFHDGNASHRADQKQSSFPRWPYSYNTNWVTAVVCMIVSKEVIRKATVRVDTPLECLGCTSSPRYHVDRLHMYIN